MKENLKILVIDDQLFMFTMIEKILKQNGFTQIDYAPSGFRGVELDEQKNYDLITCDITMPEMNGIETARKIFKSRPDKKIILVTAMGQESIIKEAITAGIRHYLLKPFSPEKFIEKINATLA